jgi:hypothetical protein
MVAMRTSALVLAASTAALFTLVSERPAHALGPIDLEIAAKAGYGSNDLDFGIGGRAGISFFGLYGGVSLVDYLGQDSVHVLTYGGEVGFGIKIAFVTIRPLLGFGDAVTSTPLGSSGSFYLQPAGLLQFSFGHLIFGVDAGALIPTSNAVQGSGINAAFTMDGQVGVRF